MKSIFNKKFNHDQVANDYDEDVKNENNPIREGYMDLMVWVSDKCINSKNVIDLGSGTGNTVMNLPDSIENITCVDISQNMINIAKDKLKDRSNIEFIKSDLLYFLDTNKAENVDTIVSTYAIHHLTQKEKHILFEKIYNILPKNGKIVFGDLMFKDRGYEQEMKVKYPNLIDDFNDELYWYLDEEKENLESLGFSLTIKKFSDLSWGIYGEK